MRWTPNNGSLGAHVDSLDSQPMLSFEYMNKSDARVIGISFKTKIICAYKWHSMWIWLVISDSDFTEMFLQANLTNNSIRPNTLWVVSQWFNLNWIYLQICRILFETYICQIHDFILIFTFADLDIKSIVCLNFQSFIWLFLLIPELRKLVIVCECRYFLPVIELSYDCAW